MIGVLTAIMAGAATIGFAQESVSVRATLMTGESPVTNPSAAAREYGTGCHVPNVPTGTLAESDPEVTVKDVGLCVPLHDGKQVAVLVEEYRSYPGSGRCRCA
ncbi:MAG: hypothetical protein IPK92_14870 [Nitrospira sp.]|nr:hypothetical protein [Nitrospira sp.]